MHAYIHRHIHTMNNETISCGPYMHITNLTRAYVLVTVTWSLETTWTRWVTFPASMMMTYTIRSWMHTQMLTSCTNIQSHSRVCYIDVSLWCAYIQSHFKNTSAMHIHTVTLKDLLHRRQLTMPIQTVILTNTWAHYARTHSHTHGSVAQTSAHNPRTHK